jgi:hypothetical protein
MPRPCCCGPPMIANCEEFHALWATFTECHLNISGVSNVGCTNCVSGLAGDWILEGTFDIDMIGACNAARTAPGFDDDDFGAVSGCTVGATFFAGENGYQVWPECVLGQVDLYLASLVGSSACKILASRSLTFPFTAADFMAGTMINSGAPASPACHIAGDVPYEFFV